MSLLFDYQGNRKYLTENERKEFLQAAMRGQAEVYTFCATLAYTGARISEVLALTPLSIDCATESIVIATLKKRGLRAHRAVPVPSHLLIQVEQIHGLKRLRDNPLSMHNRVWPWSRTTAWKHVKTVMRAAGISGSYACPKALRHSFGVTAVQNGVPLNMVRKWLGHARLDTTAIYADAIGNEEREIAGRFWIGFGPSALDDM